MPRLEYLSWQQHVVTAKACTFQDGNVSCVLANGEKRSFKLSNLIWLTEHDTHVRLCYREKVATSGAKVKRKTTKALLPGFSIVTLGDGSQMTVNRRLYRFTK